MHIVCPHCTRTLEFSGERPSFCAYCGQQLAAAQLASTAAHDREAGTVASLQTSHAEVGVPAVVGGYRLLHALGEGGMGTVYAAEETTSGRRVALKLLAPDCALSAEVVERFRQEGRLASAIAHPRCVFVLAADEEAGQPYIVMELMPGSTLEDLVKQQGPLRPDQAIAKILDVIDGLQEAHRLGVIHRDVKPSNCFLEADGRVKVGDFGLAKSLVHDTHLTRTGSFLGTILYASPEQIRKDPLDEQTDVYSLAATLYFLLTGRAPFESRDAAAALARIVSDPAPPLRSVRPEIPAALDRVVLRGLERQRERRWRSLAEFREALLPFLPGHLSIGGLGVRFAAFLLDYFLLILVAYLLGLALITYVPDRVMDPVADYRPAYLLLYTGPWVAYFTLSEALAGCSLGKWLLQLRVSTHGGDRPGLVAVLVRTLVLCGLLNLGNLVAMVLVQIHWPSGAPLQQIQADSQLVGLVRLMAGGGLLLGLSLALGVMRARNGYRGLHEFASGTRVVRLPWPQRRRASWGPATPLAVTEPTGQPDRLGPYRTRGILQSAAEETILLASDPALQRDVWIWLRRATEPPLSAARRDCTRATRQRWLGGGVKDGWRWDAFLAQTGCLLAQLVNTRGGMSWADVRLCLEQLTDELAASMAEGLLPAALDASQVWLLPNGGVQLLDFSPTSRQAAAAIPAHTAADAQQADDRRALDFLGRVAVILLGQRETPGKVSAMPLLPAPGQARRLLGGLLGSPPGYQHVKELQADLAAARQEPAEVDLPRRAAHLAALAAFLFVGLFCMLSAGWTLRVWNAVLDFAAIEEGKRLARELDAVTVRDCALTAFDPSPTGRLGRVGRLQADLAARESLRRDRERAAAKHEARLSELSWYSRQYILSMEKVVQAQQELQEAARQPSPEPRDSWIVLADAERGKAASRTTETAFFWIMFILVTAWTALWVVWAFLFRGGLSYRLVGIALVRADGRPAPRWRCAWRALLVWAPVTAALVLSLWLDAWYWSTWQPADANRWWVLALATVLWWLALVTLMAYVALALWKPTRAVHDCLAGTYLVPR
jgi:uncharacterized RDD family membrane protein YckC